MPATRMALALVATVAVGVHAGLDLSSGNRRGAVDGLPDWSKAGYGAGAALALPSDADITVTISAADLASKYNVVPNDGQDDTDGIYKAITDAKATGRRTGSFALIQLPAGTLQISKTLALDANYVILRGAGSDPANGGTKLEFRPDINTRYDVLTENGARWDQAGTNHDFEYTEDDGHGGLKTKTGTGSGGWLWPGRSMLRVGSSKIAPKWQGAYDVAPTNRKDLYLGSINYHFRNDVHNKGFMVDQSKEIAGKAGEDKIYYDSVNNTWTWAAGQDVWVASPVRSVDYDSWDVQDESYYVNAYMFQDWFTVKSVGKDSDGAFLTLDHPLAFNVYSSTTAAGGVLMENTTTPAKVMPIEDPIHHVGIENLYITQIEDNLKEADAVQNYGNMDPASAMHGIVFRYASNSWVRNVHTSMVGSHPVATEIARYLQIEGNVFDGSWNKGAGGNGYIRGSRVWDSVYYNNTLRNLRHFTFQWSAMRNVALQNDMDSDLNLHGGFEGFNLFEGNTVRVPYEHRSGSCTVNCGGESGLDDEGSWAPIYYSAGAKASKWSGSTGPQNVFFANVMQKAFAQGAALTDYTPYYKSDGSLQNTVFEFGWSGTTFAQLSLNGSQPLDNWKGNEQAAFTQGLTTKTDSAKSLFVKDVAKQAAATTTTPGGTGGGKDSAFHAATISVFAVCTALLFAFAS